MSEEICKCGHPKSEHYYVASLTHYHNLCCTHPFCACNEFKAAKERSDDMQTTKAEIDARVGQPSPEQPSGQVGAKTFENWVNKAYPSYAIRFDCDDMKAAYEAGQQNPVKSFLVWNSVSFKEWLSQTPYYLTPKEEGFAQIAFAAGQRNAEPLGRWVLNGACPYWYPIAWRTINDKGVTVAWWEWTYQIPPPPAVKRDEDEAAFYVWLDSQALKYAREKGGKP